MTFFMIFFEIFKKKLNVKKFQKFGDLNPIVGICEGTPSGFRILPLNMIAQFFVVFEI